MGWIRHYQRAAHHSRVMSVFDVESFVAIKDAGKPCMGGPIWEHCCDALGLEPGIGMPPTDAIANVLYNYGD